MRMDVSQTERLAETPAGLREEIGRSLFGLEHAVDHLLIAMAVEGHILLEDVPGVGKTALTKKFADLCGLRFKRIQCTPDMLPSDILGGLIYDPRTTEFRFRPGPIFTHILLVDEINRALPRTQSALLEAMAERQVTVDGQTYALPAPFLVIATQNPLESQGVFPLPEAQLDRFMIKASLGYPSPEADLKMLRFHLARDASSAPSPAAAPAASAPGAAPGADPFASSPAPAASVHPAPFLKRMRDQVGGVRASEEILSYISGIARATREDPGVVAGMSPRAMIMLAQAARAKAALDGRDFTVPDDVAEMAPLVILHRMVFEGGASMQELDAAAWLRELLQSVPAPVDTPSGG